MGRKKRRQIKYKQSQKRKKRMAKLRKKGQKLNEYFAEGVYIKRGIS